MRAPATTSALALLAAVAAIAAVAMVAAVPARGQQPVSEAAAQKRARPPNVLTGTAALLRQRPGALLANRLPLARPFVGSQIDQAQILRHLGTSRPVRFKPVGSTSIVYEMLLEGPVNAAFKPASRHRPGGAVAEIAAYRIARLLGLDNVPPAIARRIRRDEISSRLHPDFRDDWDDFDDWTNWDDDGTCLGAAIYWVPEMRSLGLDRSAGIRRWMRHLDHRGDIDEDEIPLHADLSRMLAFDYLIGNWDRFSGGNLQGLPDRSRLIIRDHDMAFAAPLNGPLHQRVAEHLGRTEKLSRRFVLRLLRMTEPVLRAELAQDPGAQEGMGLDDDQIAGVMDRREALLSYAAALVDHFGEERALSLP